METRAPATPSLRRRHRPQAWFVPVAASADVVGWVVLARIVAAIVTFDDTRGDCANPTSAVPMWMWVAAVVAFAAGITLASSARARKRYDTRAAGSVFWVSVISLFVMVLIVAGANVGGCSE